VKARTKFLVGGALVLGSAATYWRVPSSRPPTYYLTPAGAGDQGRRDPTFRENGVKVGAKVVPGTIQRDPGGRSLSFVMRDMSTRRRRTAVVYRGIAPDTFTDGVDGGGGGAARRRRDVPRDDAAGQCASRYENAPDQYKGAPGGAPQHPSSVPLPAASARPVPPARLW
jgi:cytochrome c-type biogenesis protein CcmE